MLNLLTRYRRLLKGVDTWFGECCSRYGEQITCHQGCSACCRGLFEISLLDARLLQEGFNLLPAGIRNTCLRKATSRRDELTDLWPGFVHPYILNRLPHADWQEMPEDDQTPCPLLGPDGSCLVYAYRPMTCRLHGLPHVDDSGEVFADDWCTLNFKETDPLSLSEIRHPFRQLFTEEFDLLGQFATDLFGHPLLELDTFIPTALLIDFDRL
ncbi:MAG: zinc/iron-chelating domain-containing protein [Desulfuromonas sp.]|nr:MAG: zinc/iron-chelating domain-containing protein [Desulfuromonas sp.]